ncbi:hypothetical protein VM77_15405 [Citromicrobium sp. JL31]|nr:hypothetical protein WG74_09115 [Citromicrobium sp. JL477]KPM12162.1 hypothetical protein VM77_15405 [Citromicrobium sp. JL31]KPM15138.1 hypothetical protein VO58_08330 [Citromicrobium sp. JL1351]
MREVLMTEKPRTGLDREKLLLWTAILGLVQVVVEIVIKAVSYARGNPKFLLFLQSERKTNLRPEQDRQADWSGA